MRSFVGGGQRPFSAWFFVSLVFLRAVITSSSMAVSAAHRCCSGHAAPPSYRSEGVQCQERQHRYCGEQFTSRGKTGLQEDIFCYFDTTIGPLSAPRCRDKHEQNCFKFVTWVHNSQSLMVKAFVALIGMTVPQIRSIHTHLGCHAWLHSCCAATPQTVQDLTDALTQVWEKKPVDTIHLPVSSMLRQCRACIQQHGGRTTATHHELSGKNSQPLDELVTRAAAVNYFSN